jgi:hypothetical protein
MKPMEFVVLALATWRLASLFANESGPYHIFKTFREWVCNNHPGIGEGLTCEWCNSVWFGSLITVAYFLWGGVVVWICTPLAFSTITIMLKYFRERLER